MATHGTRFSEFRRGLLPSEFVQKLTTSSHLTRVEGAAIDSPVRNYLQLSGPGTRTPFTWTPPDGDTGRANQESLVLFRADGSSIAALPAGARTLSLLRVHASADTMYRASLLYSTQALRINKLVAGVSTDLVSGAASSKPLRAGAWYWMRFRANSTTLSLRLWADGDAEPGSWDLTTTDSAIADGSVGIQTSLVDAVAETWQVAYLGVGTNGDTAIGPESLPASLEELLANPGNNLEVTAELEYRDTETDTVSTVWASTHGRTTGPADYPPDTVFEKLVSAGRTGYRLESDLQFGGIAARELGPLDLGNLPIAPETDGPLDGWRTLSFFGRPIILRAGAPGEPHRSFEPVEASVAAAEPLRGLEKVTVERAHAQQFLDRVLPVGKYVGIPNALESMSSTGWVSIPSHASYSTASFLIMGRWYVPVTGVAGSGEAVLSRRGSGTSIQWEIALGQTTNANAHKVIVRGYATDTTVLFVAVSTATYNAGAFVRVILGVDAAQRWFALVNGVLIGSGTITKSSVTPSSVVELMRTATGIMTCDHRIEKFQTEDEALARFSALLAPDSRTLAMHRCDDNTGATVTDYTTTANHGAVGGTVNVDFRWSPSYLGMVENAGVEMPVLEGVVFHAPTVPTDSNREIHRFADRARTTGTDLTVRAKYLALTAGVGYTAEPAPGVVDVIGASDQPVSVGLSATAGVENRSIHVAQLVSESLQARGSMSVRTADLASFLALRQLLPMKGGHYYPAAPLTANFLGNALAALGSHSFQDSSGRAAVGQLLPPVNPGPYGQRSLLEFLGYAGGGVTKSYHSSYALTQGAFGWGLIAIIKPARHDWKDPSTSSTFTYFPAGMTLIDGVSGATGYYLGIDGRTGAVIFGAPGVTGSVTGLHFLSAAIPFRPDTWYSIVATQTDTTRSISWFPFVGDAIVTDVSESTTGTVTAQAAGTPLRIGHGPFGSFCGSIAYAIGSSPYRATIPVDEDEAPTVRDAGSDGVDRFFFALDDGEGDTATEAVQVAEARLQGVRWAPRLTIDLTSTSEYTFDGMKSLVPASRVKVPYRHNYLPLFGANVAGGVSASDRVAAAAPFLSEEALSEEIRAEWPGAKDLTAPPDELPGVLAAAADADFIAYHLAQRLSPGMEVGDIGGWRRDAMGLQLGDEVLVIFDRYELDAGRPYRVAHRTRNLDERTVDLGLWGPNE